jgi:hypothetical protein
MTSLFTLQLAKDIEAAGLTPAQAERLRYYSARLNLELLRACIMQTLSSADQELLISLEACLTREVGRQRALDDLDEEPDPILREVDRDIKRSKK